MDMKQALELLRATMEAIKAGPMKPGMAELVEKAEALADELEEELEELED